MIIGITGTLGAGKGTIVEHLKKKGFKHYSVRDFLIKEIEERGLPVDRDSMVLVANQIREMNSPSYIVERLFEMAEKEGGDAIIESIRTPGEVEAIREKGGYVIGIDAIPSIRYVRIVTRQSETDNISYEEFLEHEQREMESSDPNKQNLSKCLDMADVIVQNNSDFNALFKQIEEVYEELLDLEKMKTPIRPSWDEYFMKIAAVVAERSTCLRHNIGAVIVRDKRILTTGYNGAVRGADDCLTLGCKKDELGLESGFGSEECRAVHAEQNAIVQAAYHGISIKDATLYCTTIPCRMCAKEIVNAGIKEVVTYSDYAGAKGSIEFLESAGVKFRRVERPKSEIKFKD